MSSWTECADPRNPKSKKLVKFYNHPRWEGIKNQDDAWSEDTIPHVDIKAPGQQDFVTYACKTGDQLQKFAKEYPEAYAAYVEGQEVAVQGTPLSDLPGLDSITISQWGLYGIYTVEQLAEANDATLATLGLGARSFQNAAKEKLELQELRELKALKEQARLAKVNAEAEGLENDEDTTATGAGRDEHDRGAATLSGSGGERAGREKASGRRKPGRPRTRKKELVDSAKGSDGNDHERDESVQPSE